MHEEAIWLPTIGKKTVAATDGRLCKGDFLQTIEQILIFIPTAADFLKQRIGRITTNRRNELHLHRYASLGCVVLLIF